MNLIHIYIYRKFITRKNFVELSKNLDKYRSEKNFVGSSK